MFNDISSNIIDSLNDLTRDQLKVLFGDAERFKNWLKNKKIEDNVSIN